MKLTLNKVCITLLLTLFSLSALAQNIGIGNSGGGSCNSGNAENIGQHIVDYLLCGASFLNQTPTLFSAMSLVLNTFCLMISLFLITVNGVKYVAFTMQYGVPGGQKIQGGIAVIRSGLLVTMLAPIVSNGFSPIQVLMRDFTEMGLWLADVATDRTIKFISSEGAITNVDPENIEDVTKSIIQSEMCAQMYYLHHKQDVINTADKPAVAVTESMAHAVRPTTRYTGGDVTIKWDYYHPKKNMGANEAYYSDLDNQKIDSVGGACGSLEITIPSALSRGWFIDNDINYDGASDTFSYPKAKSWQQPFVQTFDGQYQALKTHIANVRNILAPMTADMQSMTEGSAIASENDPTDINLNEIKARQDAEFAQAQIIANKSSDIVNQLIAANADYRSAIAAVGKSAASQVSLTNNVVSEDCDTDDKNCISGESWQQQLSRQGFAALGAYYYVYMTINQKILTLQQHLVTPKDTPIFKTTDNANVSAIVQSPTSLKVAERSDSIIAEFTKLVDASTFGMKFSAVENMGNTAEEIDGVNPVADVWNFVARKWNGLEQSGVKKLLSLAQDKTGNLILTLVNIGSVLSTIGASLATAAVVFAAASKFGPGKLASKLSEVNNSVKNFKVDDGEEKNRGIGSWLLWAALFCVVVGGLLQYALPAVPMFKWLLELQSWAIMMFMAFIYAPLWIMAHAAITDDRFMSEQTMAGYGLVFELMLRPILMVFSFFAMILLLRVADIGFQMMMSYLLGMMSLGGAPVIGMIFTICIAIFTGYQLAMRTFDIMASLPDYIIQRVNFGARPLGDTSNEHSHSRFFAGGLKIVNAGVGQGVSGLAKAAGLIAKDKAKPIDKK